MYEQWTHALGDRAFIERVDYLCVVGRFTPPPCTWWFTIEYRNPRTRKMIVASGDGLESKQAAKDAALDRLTEIEEEHRNAKNHTS